MHKGFIAYALPLVVLLGTVLSLMAPCVSYAAGPSEAIREFRLIFVKCNADILGMVKDALDSGGTATHISSSNSILVEGSAESINHVEALLSAIDSPPGQVLIEARIVEVSKSSSNELGVNWQGAASQYKGDVFGGPGVVDGSFALNFPMAEGAGASFGIGYVKSRESLNLRISALEQRGSARVVSSPSIQVMDNHRAVISDGIELIVPSAETSTVINTGGGPVPNSRGSEPETFSANLELAVIPRIASGGRVSMALDIRQEQFDFSADVKGYPPKRRKSARTDLVVESGQTVVIGGISIQSSLEAVRGVPFLSRIPLLGWLFRGRVKSDSESELVIFLTPTIVIVDAPADMPEY